MLSIVHQISDSEDGISDFFVDSVESKSVRNGQAYVDLEVGPKLLNVSFKIDTGSQVNILPEHIYHKLGIKHVLQKPPGPLFAYNGGVLQSIGYCNLPCIRDNNDITVDFQCSSH